MMEASELIERLEKATGPDREIDGLIVKALCPGALLSLYVVGDDEPSVFHAQALGIADKDDVPRLTASLDAALALVERVRPGCDIDLEIRELMTDGTVKRVTDATIYGRAYSDEADAKAYANSPPLALCLALLKAVPNCPPQEHRD